MKLRTIECKESNRDAFKLGLAAAVLLALAHVTSNLLSGCICTSFMEELERSSSTNRKIWFACLIFSWYLCVFQFSSLLTVYSSESREWLGPVHRSTGPVEMLSHVQKLYKTGHVAASQRV